MTKNKKSDSNRRKHNTKVCPHHHRKDIPIPPPKNPNRIYSKDSYYE